MAGAYANSEENQKELRSRIELRLGFEQLRENLNECGEDKFRKESEEANRQGEVGRILPTILEEGETESVYGKSLPRGFSSLGESAISENLGIRGERVIFQDIQLPRNGYRGMPHWEGGNDIIMGDLVEVVSGDLLDIGDESGKAGKAHMVKCKG